MHIAASERVDEGDIPHNVTGARPDVAVEVPASPGTVGDVGASAHVGTFATGGLQRADHKTSRYLLMMKAWG
jgi:hypothetical protein